MKVIKMKKLMLFVLLSLFFSLSVAHADSITKMPKGIEKTAHSAITATATSEYFNMIGYSLLLIETDFTAGSGTWEVSVLGCLTETGTYVPWNEGTAELSTGSLTADSGNAFKGIPNFIKILATESVDGATITVRVQAFN